MANAALLALSGWVALAATAKPPATGFLARHLPASGRELRYQVYVPAAYTPRRSWPVVLFLHGSGERGADNLAQLREGLAPAIRAHAHWFPLLAVFPQAPAGARWRDATEADVMRILDAVDSEWQTDRDRTYVVGMSMGGYGAWQLAMDHPDRFAAIVPVCAGVLPPPTEPELLGVKVPDPAGDPYAQIARAVAKLPIWIFHGAADPVVPVGESRRMARELAKAGGDPRYTEYPFTGHDAWDPTFNSPDLWDWLLQQRRPAGARRGAGPRG
jgi:predicted peptidase